MRIKFFAAAGISGVFEDNAEGVCPLIDVLCIKFGDRFREYCMNGDKISKNIQILINGKPYMLLGGENTPIHRGDEIIVCPAIGGG